jgi:hypothetical protein
LGCFGADGVAVVVVVVVGMRSWRCWLEGGEMDFFFKGIDWNWDFGGGELNWDFCLHWEEPLDGKCVAVLLSMVGTSSGDST